MKDSERVRRVVLVDYDEDLFDLPPWVASEFAAVGLDFAAARRRTTELVLEMAAQADIVLIQSVRPLLTAAVIDRLKRCRCIVRLGIGYDSVDVTAATTKGILVCNTPTYCVDDVADHALALLLDANRHVALQDRWIRAGKWDRTGARPARRMKDCTMGLIAFGRIARALAERMRGFGMKMLAYDPYIDAEAMARFGAQKAELDDLLSQADFISIHSPLTEQTYHLLGRREFGLMKRGVYVVNASRGPLIDEAALVEALECGKVQGAGLDVTEQEPLPLDSPLRRFENVTFTPHVGANSEESVVDLYRTGREIAFDVCNGRWPKSVVNPEAAANSPVRYARA